MNSGSPHLQGARVAIVGTGPAGLMAAYVCASKGLTVTVFEKRKSSGRKLLIAGSSGLNISYDCPDEELASHYRTEKGHFEKIFKTFPREKWIQFVESLGLETFKGTSRRYFVREMKASGLLKAWTEKLRSLGVQFEFGKEITEIATIHPAEKITLSFNGQEQNGQEQREFDACGFFLGGGSWEPDEIPLRWPKVFEKHLLQFHSFQPSNAGFEVDWPEALLKEAEGLPLKNIILKTDRGERKGELMITSYGLEGTPIYAMGSPGTVYLNLKPDLSAKEIWQKLNAPKENLAPMRRIKKYLKLSPGSEALLFHMSQPAQKSDLKILSELLQNFPIVLKKPRPLAESISSSGGIDLSELNSHLMFKKLPGVFAGGEMLNWDAPTGGFLIQGSVSQGYAAGQGIIHYLTGNLSSSSKSL